MSSTQKQVKGNTGKGNKSTPAATSQTAKGSTENSGKEESNDGGSNEGDGKTETGMTNVTENGNGTENAPIVPAAGTDTLTPAAGTDGNTDGNTPPVPAVKIMAKKMPPLKNAKRSGGGHTAGSGKPTYNLAIVNYNDLVVDKNGKLKYIPFIANGNWCPTFNGDTQEGAAPIDKTQPVFETMEAAIAAGAVEFGMKVEEKDMVKLYAFAQNIQLLEAGAPLTGKVHESDGKKWKKGDVKLYSCFLTATAENYEAVLKNLKYYIEHPSTVGNREIIELLPAPHNLTYPVTVPAQMGVPAAENAAESNELVNA